MKDPTSKYDFKRSKYLQKVKIFHDAEATIIGHGKGKGRLTGLLGYYECENESGARFKVGSGLTDKMRQKGNVFKIGTVITYKYFEVSKYGIPRFPTFLRLYKPA